MTTVQKIVPVPTMLTADTDGDTVASELTDPLAAWSEQIAKAASDWNPCMTEMTGKETMRDSDVDTESESETETEYETDTDASSSSSSYNSSSEGYGRDEDRPRYQPSLRKKQSMSRRKRHEAGEEDFDPMQAVFDFVGWLLEPSIGSDDEDWSNALTASDQDLLNRHILRKEGRQVAAQLDHESNLAHAKKPNLLLNERHIESGRHLRSDHGSTYHDHVVVATEVGFAVIGARPSNISLLTSPLNNFPSRHLRSVILKRTRKRFLLLSVTISSALSITLALKRRHLV